MEEKHISIQQLLRLIKTGRQPNKIKYLGIDYYYENGNYYSTIANENLAKDIDKYPQLLQVSEKIIEIL